MTFLPDGEEGAATVRLADGGGFAVAVAVENGVRHVWLMKVSADDADVVLFEHTEPAVEPPSCPAAERWFRVKTLGAVVPGDVLDYGAYGPCDVATVDSYLGGWNGHVPLTEVRFTNGLGFTAASDRPARISSEGR